MMSFAERMLQEARLVMLQELRRQTTGRLPILSFEAALEVEGHNHSPDWVMTQCAKLEELGVIRRIRIADAGPFRLAQLTDLGRRFLERKVEIAGIKRPDFDVDL